MSDTDKKRLEVLKYILRKHTDPTVTSLMKITYLADLLALKEGDKITDYKYVRYYYGPFDKRIYHDIEVLAEENLIQSEPRYSGNGDGDEYYIFRPSRELIDAEPQLLSSKEMTILDSLLNDIRGYGAKTLTEAAYKTKPMTKLGATLGGNEHLMQPLDLNA